MNLKPLEKRLHNIMFHTHTVAGIVISFALFVIFYAGAFSLFRADLYQWENQKARFEIKENINYDSLINVLKTNYPLYKNSVNYTISAQSEENPLVKIALKVKNTEGKKKVKTFYVNPHTGETLLNLRKFSIPNKSLTYMGETLYRLHYFRQLIPSVGIYISGLVSFFFLFAIVTGVLVHWKSTVNKFYAFTTKGNWKQIWTNSHTTLGFIALPFQFFYALTGALFGLSLLFLAPSAYLLFDGDTNEITSLVSTEVTYTYSDDAKKIENAFLIKDLFDEVHQNYPNYDVKNLSISNFGKQDGTFIFNIIDNISIAGGVGTIVYSYKNGEFGHTINLDKKTYTGATFGILKKLHYVNFGGFFVRIIYFILAMITCYIIISGVLIWQKARDNKKYTNKQRRFHHRVTKFYLAICLSMYPAFALIFIANKIIPLSLEGRVGWVQTIFFTGWGLFTFVGLFWDNYGKANRNYLFIGSVLALIVPIANGIVTKDWFWKTFANHQYYVFSVDFSWLLSGIFGLIIVRNINLTPKKPVAVDS